MNYLGLFGSVLIFAVVFYAALVGGIGWCGRRAAYQRRREGVALRRSAALAAARQQRGLEKHGISLVRHGAMPARDREAA